MKFGLQFKGKENKIFTSNKRTQLHKAKAIVGIMMATQRKALILGNSGLSLWKPTKK